MIVYNLVNLQFYMALFTYYSVDLLLQDDDTTIRNLVSGIDSIHLAPKMDSSILNIGTFSHIHDGSQVAHPISNPASSTRYALLHIHSSVIVVNCFY